MTSEMVMNRRLSKMPIEDLLNWSAVAPQARHEINAIIIQRVGETFKNGDFSPVETLLSASERRINPQCAYEDAEMLFILALNLQGNRKVELATRCAVLAKRNVEIMPDNLKKVEMYLLSESNGLQLVSDMQSLKEYPKMAFDILKKLNEADDANYRDQTNGIKYEKEFPKLCLSCARSLMGMDQIDIDVVKDCVAMAEKSILIQLQLSKIEKEDNNSDTVDIKFGFNFFVMDKAMILLSLGYVQEFLNFYSFAEKIKDVYGLSERDFRHSFVRALGSFEPKIEMDPYHLDGINSLLKKIVNPNDVAYGEFEGYFRRLTNIVKRVSYVSPEKSVITFLTLDRIFRKHNTYYGEKEYKDWQRNMRDLLSKEVPAGRERDELRFRLDGLIESYNFSEPVEPVLP